VRSVHVTVLGRRTRKHRTRTHHTPRKGTRGRIFGGWTREQLRALTERLRNADTSSDPGGTALATLLRYDDATSIAIASVSLYGAAHSDGVWGQARQSAELRMIGACMDWRDHITREPYYLYANCLEYLVRN
jgi:hypothetical protein